MPSDSNESLEPQHSVPQSPTSQYSQSKPKTRKTRFVCISDTHNSTPHGSFKLPKGDVLIHAGDLTNQGSYSELQKSIKWIEEADFEAKIIIAGNHDITLDADFYSQYGLYFHNQSPETPTKCQELLSNSPSILYLNHEAAEVNLSSPNGPHTTFRIFGSPYSPAKGMWAFGYSPQEAEHKWDDISLDVDIVVTHTPPKYHCDESKDRRAAGCEYLRQALWRVRPKLAVCGHVHEGRGAETIRWDLGTSNVKYKEESVKRWDDTGKDNKKLSHIDLTLKGNQHFENDGALGKWDEIEGLPCFTLPTTSNDLPLLPENAIPDQGSLRRKQRKLKPLAKIALSNVAKTLVAVPEEDSAPTRGQGGVEMSLRCDLEALVGREGRRDTCVVNAAIMERSWPHAGGEGKARGKRFNKPVVVDLELGVWE